MQFSGNFEQILGSGPAWGQNSAGGPPDQNPGPALVRPLATSRENCSAQLPQLVLCLFLVLRCKGISGSDTMCGKIVVIMVSVSGVAQSVKEDFRARHLMCVRTCFADDGMRTQRKRPGFETSCSWSQWSRLMHPKMATKHMLSQMQTGSCKQICLWFQKNLGVFCPILVNVYSLGLTFFHSNSVICVQKVRKRWQNASFILEVVGRTKLTSWLWTTILEECRQPLVLPTVLVQNNPCSLGAIPSTGLWFEMAAD